MQHLHCYSFPKSQTHNAVGEVADAGGVASQRDIGCELVEFVAHG